MARLRRLRGLLGLSIASAVAWIPLAAIGSVLESIRVGRSITLKGILAGAPMSAAVGAFCGFTLGIALTAAQRRRTIESLSMSRFVALGAGSALVIPATAILTDFAGFSAGQMAYALAMFGITGGLTAAALLAVARRAPREVEPAIAPVALDGPSSPWPRRYHSNAEAP